MSMCYYFYHHKEKQGVCFKNALCQLNLTRSNLALSLLSSEMWGSLITTMSAGWSAPLVCSAMPRQSQLPVTAVPVLISSSLNQVHRPFTLCQQT